MPPQSPEALAAAMFEMIRNPDRARQMGVAGRRRAVGEFTWRVVIRAYQTMWGAQETERAACAARHVWLEMSRVLIRQQKCLSRGK